MNEPTYISLEHANAYMNAHMYKQDWEGATIPERQAALRTATLDIDNLNLKGYKTSATQPLRFPRDGETQIPVPVKYACIEIAVQLLQGKDPDAEHDQLALATRQYGPLRDVRDTSIAEPHKIAGIVSLRAWNFLVPYLNVTQELRMKRGN